MVNLWPLGCVLSVRWSCHKLHVDLSETTSFSSWKLHVNIFEAAFGFVRSFYYRPNVGFSDTACEFVKSFIFRSWIAYGTDKSFIWKSQKLHILFIGLKRHVYFIISCTCVSPGQVCSKLELFCLSSLRDTVTMKIGLSACQSQSMDREYSKKSDNNILGNHSSVHCKLHTTQF